MAEPQRPYVGVHIFLIKDDKLLLMKRGNTQGLSGRYAMVAGKADFGESPSVAMLREAYEEAGVTIHPEDLKLMCIFHRAKTEFHGKDEDVIELVFKVEKWDGEITNMEPELCEELAFFDMNAVPDTATDSVRRAIHCYREKIPYVEV